ncbi:MAG TPA: exodeoxyribonuclease III [Stellaceae bacterium]|jgi:exodeoxyribonuclease-3|nr:exodeoxyribonuclease III [Stellaceae bacterium]
MALNLVTWNINSVRLRIDLVKRVVDELKPDIFCLQETKTPDEFFPREAAEAMGFQHMLVHGMKGYNGVAILSKLPLDKSRNEGWCGKTDCRHIIAELPNGIELHNVYVPAGGDIPDPEENPKFAHKLRFIDEVAGWFKGQRASDKPMILVGDLNVAPLETDVWSHKQLLKVVSHTPVEVEKFGRMQESASFVDAVRHFIPPEQRLYTWWSYRARDWAASDRGRRLDHVWVTPVLKDRLAGAAVHKDSRNWELCSDHVPVLVRLYE